MAKIQSASSVAGKETLYVDVDDEITAIIDKVGSAKGKVVALVLPKRCAVLQSIVNMKLLKRTAEAASKHVVLVTTEAGLMPLAGAVGLYVASTPTSKPSVPDAPGSTDADGVEDVEEPLKVVDGNAPDDGDFDTKAAGAKSVGELAASSAAKADADDLDGPIDMAEEAGKPADKVRAPKPKKNKKLKVPNFDSFRKKMVVGVAAAVLLLGGGIYALVVLPHATITISTDSSTISTNLTLHLDTSATKLDTAGNTVPAVSQSQQSTATQTVPATGQQNNGQKATGQVTITNCSGNPVTIQAGSSLSASGHTFIAQNSTVVPDSNYTHNGDCKNDGKGSVDVTALKGGADYNLAATSYTLTNSPAGVTAQGSQMSGGTDNITTIVQQSDINNATSKINASNSDSVKQQLVTAIKGKGLQPIAVTLLAGTPQVTTSAKVGDAANNVTVTSVTVYTMLGVKKTDLQTLVKNNVEGQLDKGKQVILDDGVANADFTEANPGTADKATVAMSAKSEAGPQINVTQLKTTLAGKKSGDVKSYIKQTPGVTDVKVKFGPFWVNTVPKKAGKVTIDIVKAGS